MRSRLLFFLCCTSATLVAQHPVSKTLEGRVYSDDGDVSATHVLNLTSQRATITDTQGFFSIPVKLHDTLAFSAVQYQKKIVVITLSILESKEIAIGLEEAVTVLDEVTVTPYNLSGNILKDIATLETDPVVTASTLGLPNAYVRIPTKAERQLFEAKSGSGLIPLNPIINGISGRTKMLKERVARNALYARTERVREFYADSLYQSELKIPLEKIDDFLYFCEVDDYFQYVVDSHDLFKIWEYLRKKSILYRKNNNLE